MRKAIILCYHKVGPVAEEGRRLNIEPERLSAHARFFARRGFRFARACDLMDPWSARTVCFTFDDAYASTMQSAPAILEEAGGRGSFYAVSDKVGLTSDWDGELARPLAPWSVLVEVQARGHEIGNHTCTHPHLHQLTRAQQLSEIADADRAMRERGLSPASFCYPYGSLCPEELLTQCGYSVGLALGKRVATEGDDRQALPRIVVAYSDSIAMLLYRIHLRPRLRRSA